MPFTNNQLVRWPSRDEEANLYGVVISHEDSCEVATIKQLPNEEIQVVSVEKISNFDHFDYNRVTEEDVWIETDYLQAIRVVHKDSREPEEIACIRRTHSFPAPHVYLKSGSSYAVSQVKYFVLEQESV